MKCLVNPVRAAGPLCLLVAAAIAHAQPLARGDRLTTPAGLTLYTFANDAAGSGKSACYPPCSNLHPPYLVEQGADTTGDHLSIVERSDGTKQWAHKGRPLYLWIYDQKPGEAGADGMNRGTWQIAKP